MVAHEPRSISAHYSSAMGSGASAVKAESDLLPEAPVLDKDEYVKEHHKLLGGPWLAPLCPGLQLNIQV